MASNTRSVQDHLKSLYSIYRRTTDIDAKGLFFSPDCMQICRPQPAYAARDRQTIVRFLHEAIKMGTNLATEGQSDGEEANNATNWKRCTIRPTKCDELEFASDEITTPAGFTALDLREKAEKEGWEGMRVDLWSDEGFEKDILVKVRYWWRKEDDEWLQILHDIMYMGPRDGTEGRDGELL